MRGRTWTPLLLAIAACLLLVSGCADSSRATGSPTPRPFAPENPSRPPTPQTWLGEVCGALLPVATPPTTPDVDPRDPAASRDRWADHLAGRAEALDHAADAINTAGPAPVAAGQQVTAPVVGLLRDRAQQARQAVRTLHAVPGNAPATLLRTVEQVRSQFSLVGATDAWADLALPPQLTRAAATVPPCRRIGAPA